MAFVGRRLLHSIFVLWAVATILFLMFRLMPGNPLAAYISEALSAEQQNLIMQQFGLDRPLWEQYVSRRGQGRTPTHGAWERRKAE